MILCLASCFNIFVNKIRWKGSWFSSNDKYVRELLAMKLFMRVFNGHQIRTKTSRIKMHRYRWDRHRYTHIVLKGWVYLNGPNPYPSLLPKLNWIVSQHTQFMAMNIVFFGWNASKYVMLSYGYTNFWQIERCHAILCFLLVSELSISQVELEF